MEQSDSKNYLSSEKEYFLNIENYFNNSSGTFSEKLHAFPRFVPRQYLAYFLARTEIYKKILSLHGSIFDFGVYRGSSLFTWNQLATIYEPYNHLRKIIGFDSFKGFSEIKEHDIAKKEFKLKFEGGMKFENGYQELNRGIDLMNLNRPLGHVNNSDIINGILPETLKNYLEDHPETIVSLANFGLGLYEPTVEILKLLKPRMQKGTVLVLEDLNQENWPGETKALFEVFNATEIHLERFPFSPHISYMIIGGSE
jgi:hypothetical protein